MRASALDRNRCPCFCRCHFVVAMSRICNYFDSLIGFGREVSTRSPKAVIDRMFAPEFCNRLSAVYYFIAVSVRLKPVAAGRLFAYASDRIANRSLPSRVRDPVARDRC
jgi:hypothetical protein